MVSRNPHPSSTSTTRKLPLCSPFPFHHHSPAARHSPKSTAVRPGTTFCLRPHHLFSQLLFSQLLFSHRVLLEFLPLAPKSLPTLAQPPMSRSSPTPAPGSRSHPLIHRTGTSSSG